MISINRRRAGRQKVNALVPVFGKKALPQIYLQETAQSRPAVFLPETGYAGVGARFKWLASTCFAALVGVGVIGVSVCASMNVDEGTDIVSSIRQAGAAALQPIQRTRAVKEDQMVAGQKTDRIKTTARGLATRQIIHESVEQRVGDKDYIKIKPYARVVARLATAQPDEIDRIPRFNPFKLYANKTPIGATGSGDAEASGARQIAVSIVEFDGHRLPVEDGFKLTAVQVSELISDAGDVYNDGPYAMRPAIHPEAARDHANPSFRGLVHRAAYRPDTPLYPGLAEQQVPANTTVVEKSLIEADEEEIQNTDVQTVTVKAGDTLMSILVDAGAERWQAKAIYEAMAPMFTAKALRKGQEVRLTLAPAPSDSGQMEPIKVSIFAGDKHEVTVARNGAGDFVVSEDPITIAEARRQGRSSDRATLYASFYDAALNQSLTESMITRVLRIHSSDVDFKRRVRPGDTFEVFFDLDKDGKGRETEPGELLYTAMSVAGQTRRFFRYRTPDGTVDFYDEEGNSAKKFLMRKPVKGARFTSGFGMRRHPVLRHRRMHTGADWAAPRGTPILAAGSGIVEQVGRKGGYGNYVRIRHANGFKTSYGHMARFARGLRPGVKVTQGQVIGYVGSTGLSTGPHLHFEVLVNNRHVDPMTIRVPRGRQLTGKLLADFNKERSRIEALMRRAPVTTRVAAATQDAR